MQDPSDDKIRTTILECLSDRTWHVEDISVAVWRRLFVPLDDKIHNRIWNEIWSLAMNGIITRNGSYLAQIDVKSIPEKLEQASRKTIPARLDPHGTEKPLTRIVHHPHPDHCAGPGIALKDPEYETENGERIPLAAPKALTDQEIQKEIPSFLTQYRKSTFTIHSLGALVFGQLGVCGLKPDLQQIQACISTLIKEGKILQDEKGDLSLPSREISCEVGTSGAWQGALLRQGEGEYVTEAIAFHGSDSRIKAEAVQEYLSQLPQEILSVLFAYHQKKAEES